MSDDDSFFWFLAGCAAGDQTSRLRPRDKWDAVASSSLPSASSPRLSSHRGDFPSHSDAARRVRSIYAPGKGGGGGRGDAHRRAPGGEVRRVGGYGGCMPSRVSRAVYAPPTRF